MKRWLYYTLTDIRDLPDYIIGSWLTDRIDDLRYTNFFREFWSDYDE